MDNMFNGMFGKVGNGMCRLAMMGGVAVKTSNGYKTYDIDNNRLTNCSNFVFDIGEEFFFVVPTKKVKKGDIIIVSGTPRCVIKSEDNVITVINYEDSTIENILPEHYVFMGNTYLYGKIVSMFGENLFGNQKGTNKIIKYMMISEMMKGQNASGNSMNGMLPFMMMGGSMENVFEGIFDIDDEEET